MQINLKELEKVSTLMSKLSLRFYSFCLILRACLEKHISGLGLSGFSGKRDVGLTKEPVKEWFSLVAFS